MRALLVGLMLVAVAVPATADHITLEITDLVLTFNPLSQATEYSFTLHNAGTAPTGTLRANTHDDVGVKNGITFDASGLGIGATKDYVVSIPSWIAVNGCIWVIGTSSRTLSEEVCTSSSGLTQAPVDEPEAPEAPEAPEVPSDPTTLLPPLAPPTLP